MESSKLLDFIGNVDNIVVPFSYHYYFSNNGTNKRILNELIKNKSIDFDELLFYEEDDELIFVDGMERFTTIYLLLCALASKFYENGDGDIYKNILDNYILSKNDDKILNLKSRDDVDLENIVNALCKYGKYEVYKDTSSSVLRTYAYFIDVLDQRRSSRSTKHYNFSSIYNRLPKIRCNVDFVSSQEVHSIFSKLNENALTNKFMCNVLIKNYFLDKLNYTHINDFKSKWTKLEEIFYEYPFSNSNQRSKYFDHFLKIYFTIKLDYTPEYNNLYELFRKYSSHNNLKEIYEDIYKYATYYNKMFHSAETDEQLKASFIKITSCCFNNRMDNSILPTGITLYSNEEMQVFLLKVYDDYQESIITKNELVYITKTIESYVIRRDLCDITYDDLDKTFINLYNNIDLNDYLNSFINQITSLKKNEVFPTDEKIRGTLIEHDFYNEKDINKYILVELENSYRYTPKEDFNDYQIEHIMPRKLSNTWKKELGQNADQINNDYVNTIGNLTLLPRSANISLSNNSFHEKVNKKDIGYKYSDIKLSEDVISQQKWDEISIKKRSAKLTEQIIKLWSYPDKNNNIEIEVEDTTTEEFNYDNQLLVDLDKKILSLDENIERINTNDYTEYSLNDYSLLYLHQKDEFIECRLNINKKDITNPEIMGKYYTYKENIRCYLHDKTDINYTINLIKQVIQYANTNNTEDEIIINDFKYPMEYYKLNKKTNKLFKNLQTQIQNINKEIIQNNNKYYIAFKLNNRTLLDVYPNEDYLELNIKLPTKYLTKEEIKNTNDNDYEKTTNIYYENTKQTETIKEIINKAYQNLTGKLTIKTEQQKYSLAYLGMKKGTLTRELFDKLDEKIKQIENLTQKNTSAYVAYKKDGRNLFYLYNEKDYLRIIIVVKPSKIPDELKIRGKYDEDIDFIAYVDEIEDIDNTIKIIKKAYELF